MKETQKKTRTSGGRHAASPAPAKARPQRSRRLPRWAIVLIAVAAVLLVLAGTAVAYVNGKLNKLNFNEKTEVLTQEEVFAMNNGDLDTAVQSLEQRDSGAALSNEDVFKDTDYVNILVCGTDMRLPGTNDQGRCDATVIVSLNMKTGDVKMVSFERAIGVPIPGYEDTKLNNAFNYGGGPFMMETITKCFRVDLAGYVHLSYETIPQVFDAIGGIDVELDQSEVYNIGEYIQYETDLPELHVGMNNLRGWAAYGYCRLRIADDDWARQSRVRNALQAALSKLKTMSMSELNKMADEVLPMIGTNLSKKQISSLILSAPKFANATVEQLMVPPDEKDVWYYLTGHGEYMMGVDYTEWAGKIRTFLYGE